MTHEQKKEYLRGYRGHVRRAEQITEQIARLRACKANPSAIVYDGMPKGCGGTDLSGYIARLDELERQLMEERTREICTYQDIVRRIKLLRSENELDVLFYRYIRGLDWWEIAERMELSRRQILRIHAEALEHLDYPEL